MQTSQCLSYRSLQEGGGPRGLPKLLKEEEKEEDDEEKKEYDEEEEMMEGQRRDEEDMEDSLMVEGGIMVKLPWDPFILVFFPSSSCFKVLSSMNQLNNHIVQMNKDHTS